ncbi:ODA2, partial [Symbiodinium sp. CCMP2456]
AAATALAAEPPRESIVCGLTLPPSRGLLTPQPVGDAQLWLQDQSLRARCLYEEEEPVEEDEQDELIIPLAGVSDVEVKGDGQFVILSLSPPLAPTGFAVDFMAEGHRISTVTLSPYAEELRPVLATLMSWLRHLTLHGPRSLGLTPRPAVEPFALRYQGTVLEERDLDLLEDEQWLNDTIMDFFMRLAIDVAAPAKLQEELYVAKTQFFTRLTACGASSGEKGWENVKTWTRSVSGGVASQRVLIYPVNEGNLHWCVFFVCHPHRAIELADSSDEHPDAPRIVCLDSAWEPVPKDEQIKLLKGYLRRELFNNPLGGAGFKLPANGNFVGQAAVKAWKAAVTGLEKMRALDADVPKQQNVYDCGLYVLEFLLYLLRAPDQFAMLGLESHQEWFDQSVISHRRGEMKQIVQRLLNEGRKSGQADVAMLLRDEALHQFVRQALTSEPAPAPCDVCAPWQPPPGGPEPKRPPALQVPAVQSAYTARGDWAQFAWQTPARRGAGVSTWDDWSQAENEFYRISEAWEIGICREVESARKAVTNWRCLESVMAQKNEKHKHFAWRDHVATWRTDCAYYLGNVGTVRRTYALAHWPFKTFYNELNHLLREYRRVTGLVKPITANLLKPHLDHLEFQLRPGMVTLTWTSMNIDGYLKSVWDSLDQLEQLIAGVNDIMESRVDANLRLVSHVLLAELPEDNRLVSLDDFVDIQERHVRHTTEWLVAKNQEIENAVNDMLGTIVAFPLDAHVRRISESEIIKVKAHYNWSMYQSLLAATKRSLHKVKERLSARPLEDGSTPPAFFEVELQLDGLGVCLQPSMEDIQSAINGGAVALLKCSKMIEAWDTVTIPSTVQLLLNPNLPPVSGTGAQGTFYDRVAQDKEILKVVLLLTGSIQSARDGKNKYLKQFERWSWLWNCDIDEEYKKFRASEPTLDEFEAKLRSFARLDDEFQLMEPRRQISALSLQAGSLARSLRELAGRWKESFARELHTQAFHRLEALSEVIKSTMKKLSREVADGDIDALGHVMRTLREVREKQGEIELELEPVAQMYAMLDSYLPNILDKEEQDARSMLQSSWTKLLAESETRHLELTVKQVQFKRNLIKTVHAFRRDVEKFRRDYEERGPMVKGIRPGQAVERLKRCKEEYEVHGRKRQIFALGEDLFGLPHQTYPQLDQTEKELDYLSQLYDLYTAVLETIGRWKDYLWVEVPGEMENMKKEADQFAFRCKKMPAQLREWPAYHELKHEIEDFQQVLPLLMELSKKSIQQRHWQQVNDITGKDLQVEREDFKLQSLIDAKLNDFKDDITDITESADKQQIIEEKLADITAQWNTMSFEFSTWKTREVPCVLVGGKVTEVQEALEETQMFLNAMNAQRQSGPFKEELMVPGQEDKPTLTSARHTVASHFQRERITSEFLNLTFAAANNDVEYKINFDQLSEGEEEDQFTGKFRVRSRSLPARISREEPISSRRSSSNGDTHASTCTSRGLDHAGVTLNTFLHRILTTSVIHKGIGLSTKVVQASSLRPPRSKTGSRTAANPQQGATRVV